MPAEVERSWAALDRGIGRNRRVVARKIGRPLSSLEKYLRPPPSLEQPNGDGQTNPLDILCTILDFAEEPAEIVEFILARRGTQEVPRGLVQGRLWVKEADLAELAEDLARELRRKKPNAERLRSCRDALADAAHRLVAAKEAKG